MEALPPHPLVVKAVKKYLRFEAKKGTQLSTKEVDLFVAKLPYLLDQELEEKVAGYLIKGNRTERRGVAVTRIEDADFVLELDRKMKRARKLKEAEEGTPTKGKAAETAQKARLKAYKRELTEDAALRKDFLSREDMKAIYKMVKEERAAVASVTKDLRLVRDYVAHRMEKRTRNEIVNTRSSEDEALPAVTQPEAPKAEPEGPDLYDRLVQLRVGPKEEVAHEDQAEVIATVRFAQEITPFLRRHEKALRAGKSAASVLADFDAANPSPESYIDALLTAVMDVGAPELVDRNLYNHPAITRAWHALVQRVSTATAYGQDILTITRALPEYVRELERMENEPGARNLLSAWRHSFESLAKAVTPLTKGR